MSRWRPILDRAALLAFLTACAYAGTLVGPLIHR